MPTLETSPQPFPEEGRDARDQLRADLDASACEMRIDRIAFETGESTIVRFSIADRVRGLGFEGEAASLVDLLPLVHVAWADGSVHAKERAAILKVLDVRGMPSGRPYEVMLALLEKKPSQAYLDESLSVLKQLCKDDAGHQKSVVQMCLDVAKSAGGFLGVFRKINPREREIIEHIADTLGAAARAEFKARML